MENGLINTYHYDKYGYYEGVVTTQVIDGLALMPPSCLKEAPELKAGFWYKVNEDETGWIAEAKPTSAQECLNITVKHEDNSARAVELKKLMQEFCNADSEHYRVKRDENLAWTVEEIPEKSFDELKEAKLTEISNEAGKYDQYKCDEMYIISSVGGWKFNADIRSQNNLKCLINQLKDGTTALYKDYDNEFRRLSKVQMQTIYDEAIVNGQNLYQIKWGLQEAVNTAISKEALDAIKIEFTMMSFK